MERIDPEADRKPFALVEGENVITVKIQRQDGRVVGYKFGSKMQLEQMYRDFCNHIGILYEATEFYYDGVFLPGHKTPEDMEMEDDDVIDAFNRQMAGGSS